MQLDSSCDAPSPPSGSPGEVFAAFLKLGLTAFGGPIAHLGYFRAEFVTRRRWLSDAAYGDLVALCQFLPGPASSQTGFALGLMRAGPLGALAAWTAFTLPSALLMIAFAYGAPFLSGAAGAGLLHGLKLVAVAVVAQAVWGMVRSLTPDLTRLAIALAAGALAFLAAGSLGQIGAIALGALAGLALCRDGIARKADHLPIHLSKTAGLTALILFALLLAGLPLLARGTGDHTVALADAFYRSGALVFGGGHVVLPLLEAETVRSGWIARDAFLAGYGAAQAVPGPLFTFSAYLGAVATPAPNGFAGAAIALIAIFLPGLLLVIAALPFWSSFRGSAAGQALMRGANAAVVGILAAALYDPVATSAIHDWGDGALALAGFALLTIFRTPSWVVVLLGAATGIAGGML